MSQESDKIPHFPIALAVRGIVAGQAGAFPQITGEISEIDVDATHVGGRSENGVWRIIALLDSAFAQDARNIMPLLEESITYPGEITGRWGGKLSIEQIIVNKADIAGLANFVMRAVGTEGHRAIAQARGVHPLFANMHALLSAHYEDKFRLSEISLTKSIAARMDEGIDMAYTGFVGGLTRMCLQLLTAELGEGNFSLGNLAYTLDRSKVLLLHLTSMDSVYTHEGLLDRGFDTQMFFTERQVGEDGRVGLRIKMKPEYREMAEAKYRETRRAHEPITVSDRHTPSPEPAGCFANAGSDNLVIHMIERYIAALGQLAESMASQSA